MSWDVVFVLCFSPHSIKLLEKKSQWQAPSHQIPLGSFTTQIWSYQFISKLKSSGSRTTTEQYGTSGGRDPYPSLPGPNWSYSVTAISSPGKVVIFTILRLREEKSNWVSYWSYLVRGLLLIVLYVETKLRPFWSSYLEWHRLWQMTNDLNVCRS